MGSGGALGCFLHAHVIVPWVEVVTVRWLLRGGSGEVSRDVSELDAEMRAGTLSAEVSERALSSRRGVVAARWASVERLSARVSGSTAMVGGVAAVMLVSVVAMSLCGGSRACHAARAVCALGEVGRMYGL